MGDYAQIAILEAQGHTHHCACRQVWGDGECDCNFTAKGYDPYKWAKKKGKEATKEGSK